MRAKKVQILLDRGCVIVEITDDTTVLRDEHGNIAKVDSFGKVLWYPINNIQDKNWYTVNKQNEH